MSCIDQDILSATATECRLNYSVDDHNCVGKYH